MRKKNSNYNAKSNNNNNSNKSKENFFIIKNDIEIIPEEKS